MATEYGSEGTPKETLKAIIKMRGSHEAELKKLQADVKAARVSEQAVLDKHMEDIVATRSQMNSKKTQMVRARVSLVRVGACACVFSLLLRKTGKPVSMARGSSFHQTRKILCSSMPGREELQTDGRLAC
mmetsp:Transcript_38337/g.96445  ORF Transcript_38337/g.96445 Transcript_38337/m.96445 type:complete len:130 (-) Transcript_38337:405-794(-)